VEKVIESWKVEYREIREIEEQIKKVIRAEEEKFQETIHQGIHILEGYIDEIIEKEEKYLNGEKAFKLYDTYGFPLELTKEILEEKGLTVDEEEFNKYMEEQRERARKARGELTDSGWKNGSPLEWIEGYDTSFKGYDNMTLETEVMGILVDGNTTNRIDKGEEGIIILKET